MLPSRTLAVGFVAFIFGAIAARTFPAIEAAQPPQKPPAEISVSTAPDADAVIFRNESRTSRFVIAGLAEEPGTAGIFSRNDGEVRIPAKGTQGFLIYRVTARYLYKDKVLTDCRPSECPAPPPCPPPAGQQCPWTAVQLAELKPKLKE